MCSKELQEEEGRWSLTSWEGHNRSPDSDESPEEDAGAADVGIEDNEEDLSPKDKQTIKEMTIAWLVLLHSVLPKLRAPCAALGNLGSCWEVLSQSGCGQGFVAMLSARSLQSIGLARARLLFLGCGSWSRANEMCGLGCRMQQLNLAKVLELFEPRLLQIC